MRTTKKTRKKRKRKRRGNRLKKQRFFNREFGKGSGGHINIFRFISYLEQNGFHNRLYIDRPVNLYSKQAMTEFVRENFKILDSNVDLYHNTEDMEYADAIVATSWQTAYFVRRFDNCISKFYFIQDYEPYFYPLGSEY